MIFRRLALGRQAQIIDALAAFVLLIILLAARLNAACTDWDRNAASRKDGYWPFISKKQEPPQALTYGEYPLPFFLELIEKASDYAGLNGDYSQASMADLGSGTGRLVLWAAVNQRWKSCLGVELLPDLHRIASEQLAAAQAHECVHADFIRADEVAFENASWDDAALGHLDVVFGYTTCLQDMVRNDDGVLLELTESLNRRLRRGCIVVTTEYRLGDGFRLIESIDGQNAFIGGVSTGHIHEKMSPGEWES